jgi:S-adenosylmethionine hydrolase
MGIQAGGIITFLSDFGISDWYVGAVKGVILSRCPHCHLVDLTHEVRPGEILQGALVLAGAYVYYPEGTVHLAVVDPGVGGPRRPILVQTAGQWFVGPDNGLFGPILQKEREGIVRHLQCEELFLRPVSPTFHGRDVFAPVAAYLASGGAAESLGPQIDDWVPMRLPLPQFGQDEISGQVLYVDHFGNGITNICGAKLAEHLGSTYVEVLVGGHRLEGLYGSYVDVPKGGLLALIGSSGFLEISVHGDRADTLLGLVPGSTRVKVRRRSSFGPAG